MEELHILYQNKGFFVLFSAKILVLFLLTFKENKDVLEF